MLGWTLWTPGSLVVWNRMAELNRDEVQILCNWKSGENSGVSWKTIDNFQMTVGKH